MTKSELIERLEHKQADFSAEDVDAAVRVILEQMSESLGRGERIEIRGFGSFSVHFLSPRIGRNPRTGEPVVLGGRHVPRFRPGKALRDRLNPVATEPSA